MSNPFLDVFSHVLFTDDEINFFDGAQLLKVSINKQEQMVRVHIEIPQIVHHRYMQSVANKLKSDVCYGLNYGLELIPTFKLSNNYDLKKIFLLYRDSLKNEIHSISPICGSALKCEEMKLNNQTIEIGIPDTVMPHFLRHQIEDRIIKLFDYRFHQQVFVSLKVNKTMEEAAEDAEAFALVRDREEKAIIAQMTQNVKVNSDNAEGEEGEKSVPTAKKAASTDKTTKAADNKKDKPQKEYSKYKKEANTGSNENDENVLYGRRPKQDVYVAIEELSIHHSDQYISTNGEIISGDVVKLKEKCLISFALTNYKDSISAKIFMNTVEEAETLLGVIKNAKGLKIGGRFSYDTYAKEHVIVGVNFIEKIAFKKDTRMDMAPLKRVELHAHTMMSDMDGVVSAKDLVKTAIKWGHKALAITDHGGAQAFPEALHASEKSDLKVIYGIEAYIADDLKPVVEYPNHQSFDDTYVIFDLETTGFYASLDQIIEIGAVKIEKGKVIDRFSTFINPLMPIPYKITQLTSITNEDVAKAPTIIEVMPQFLSFVGESIMVAHNATFDVNFIRVNANRMGIEVKNTVLDTLELARILLTDMKSHKLNNLTKHFGIKLENHHRAVDDAEATAQIFLQFIEMLKQRNITDIDSFVAYVDEHGKNFKTLKTYHGILLAKNQIGLQNLYRLISDSHIHYFYRKPRILKSVLNQYREGLLLGTACEAGELYRAILEDRPENEIEALANYYDYFEIQPVLNNEFLVREEQIKSIEELKEINKKIIHMGKKFKKLTVATCDVHFLNPEDEIYRRIVMAAQKYGDADNQAPLYFRTTEEMLEEFSYLGEDLAYEVVVTNTNLIADSIDAISPVQPHKYPPKIEGAEDDLRQKCHNKAVEMYGEPIPEVVNARLERELQSIIGNGYAVMYIIAQRLVWKSNEDGYLVGSRGSVGSSFAATMAGITEVNPLPAHYLCNKCKYNEFDSEEIRQNTGNSGCDLPDKNCPVCGEPLSKEGHDIPFETFLGFKGDKEPDIDLNFSGEYQWRAHAYTEEIFGKSHVFRAGTIGTLAEKTAYGYVKKYFEEKGINKREAEINRLVIGCTGIRKTTGQHPGGLIVVPKDQEIYKFTPIQKPANDQTTDTVTTHFDYHSIDHNLLKLDILGHDDPTMIRMLEDITGIDAKKIPMDEPKVMSLFRDTSALKVEPADILDCPLGCMGVPEFGTDFVIGMLLETNPKNFSDLVRISGLSHGTDVWLNNAQTLIKDGQATISNVISTRDDIMTYLIHMGMESGLAFTIMESVRKGKGLRSEWESAMLENNVPDWYIASCKTIKYMFPKAHAVAYVMMAYRIAYFKVYYPLAYYATFYSIRSSAFDYEIMCFGKGKVEKTIQEFKTREDSKNPAEKLSPKEKDSIKDLKLVQEMYARGYEFMPIDLFRVDAKKFQVIDGKIMPALSAIQGMGEKAAEGIVEAAKDGPFMSVEDFRNRSKCPKTIIEILQRRGILSTLPETNQLTFF